MKKGARSGYIYLRGRGLGRQREGGGGEETTEGTGGDVEDRRVARGGERATGGAAVGRGERGASPLPPPPPFWSRGSMTLLRRALLSAAQPSAPPQGPGPVLHPPPSFLHVAAAPLPPPVATYRQASAARPHVQSAPASPISAPERKGLGQRFGKPLPSGLLSNPHKGTSSPLLSLSRFAIGREGTSERRLAPPPTASAPHWAVGEGDAFRRDQMFHEPSEGCYGA